MDIDSIRLCVLLFDIASAHVNDFTYLKHVRPMPAFATTKDFKHFLSLNCDLVSQDEKVDYKLIQSEAQKLVNFFNGESGYKIKFSTAEHLLIKTLNWIPIIQIRFEIIGHDFKKDDCNAFNTFKSVWS